MAVRTFSSREFTRDVSAAKRASQSGPVFITDRGRPAYALLRIEDFRRLIGQAGPSLLQVMDGIECDVGIEFDPEPLSVQARVPEL